MMKKPEVVYTVAVKLMDNVKFDQTAEVEKSSTFNLEAEQAL